MAITAVAMPRFRQPVAPVPLRFSIVVVALCVVGVSATMEFIQNGIIKVGVDLARGGSIAYLADSDGNSVINTHDLGREVGRRRRRHRRRRRRHRRRLSMLTWLWWLCGFFRSSSAFTLARRPTTLLSVRRTITRWLAHCASGCVAFIAVPTTVPAPVPVPISISVSVSVSDLIRLLCHQSCSLACVRACACGCCGHRDAAVAVEPHRRG
jgi:hypothetical protein